MTRANARSWSSLLLLLLLLLCLFDVNAQFIDDGTTQQCGMASVRLDFYWSSTDFQQRFSRLMQPFIEARAANAQCPYGMVCAQKLVVFQDMEGRYSEECWRKEQIVEYTEIACYWDLCNANLTFGSYQNMRRSFYQQGNPIKCYNHGQLQNMNTYRRIIMSAEYEYKFRRSLPVSHWSQGMCGAAIYASDQRSRIIHERVLTGDRNQKFASLRLCPYDGCSQKIVEDFLLRGFSK